MWYCEKIADGSFAALLQAVCPGEERCKYTTSWALMNNKCVITPLSKPLPTDPQYKNKGRRGGCAFQ